MTSGAAFRSPIFSNKGAIRSAYCGRNVSEDAESSGKGVIGGIKNAQQRANADSPAMFELAGLNPVVWN